MKKIIQYRDLLWLITWISGILILAIWNIFFLNKPALMQLSEAFFNTNLIAACVVLMSLVQSWLFIQVLYLLNIRFLKAITIFSLNLIRSIPQIIGILLGYVILTYFLTAGFISGKYITILLMSWIISVFVFLEIFDLFKERIDFYKKSEFYNAMIVCGIPEFFVINTEIIVRSSFIHVLNKMISVFGIAVFLNCSIDFILSVGLSTQVNSINLPATLGSMLAQIDSKQDILAIGHTLTNWSYFERLPFEHLQGITVAFLIVFTLLCLQRTANAFARRNRL